jgi:hypothetical protein
MSIDVDNVLDDDYATSGHGYGQGTRKSTYSRKPPDVASHGYPHGYFSCSGRMEKVLALTSVELSLLF